MVIDEASKTAGPQAASLRDRRTELCQAVLAGTLPAEQLPTLLSEAADTFLAGLLEHATQGKTSGYALSALDVVWLHRRRRHVDRIADAIWYTVWDTGLHLDHSVRTRGEALEMAGSDMKVVLGLLDARHIAGDEALSQQLIEQIATLWRRDGTGRLEALSKSVTERHRSFGELAFL